VSSGELRACFDKYDCDKGHRHSYERVYEPIFEPLQNEAISILEVGVFAGSSMLAWADYFPNAQIAGIDLFRRVALHEVPKHDRVTLIEGDSRTIEIAGHFDIVIDDGAHNFISQRQTFENLHTCASRYFIEDVWPLGRMTDEELAHPWLRNKGFSADDHDRLLDVLKFHDITWHDVRDGHAPDSVIIEVRL
jgi:hypothetical protein